MRRRIVSAHEIEYIDPSDAGSTIGFRILRSDRGIWADVDLTDCNRKIEWYFTSQAKSRSIQKVDRAIEVLTRFRAAFVNACKRGRLKRKR